MDSTAVDETLKKLQELRKRRNAERARIPDVAPASSQKINDCSASSSSKEPLNLKRNAHPTQEQINAPQQPPNSGPTSQSIKTRPSPSSKCSVDASSQDGIEHSAADLKRGIKKTVNSDINSVARPLPNFDSRRPSDKGSFESQNNGWASRNSFWDTYSGRGRGRNRSFGFRGRGVGHRGGRGAWQGKDGRVQPNYVPLPSFFDSSGVLTSERTAKDEYEMASSSSGPSGATSTGLAPGEDRRNAGGNFPSSTLKQLFALDRELANELEGFQRSRALYQNASSPWAHIDTTDVGNFDTLLPEPAITFPFPLDDFQKRAILAIERGHSIFVAAHTSAGKTVVAEYAIAMAHNMGRKAIYTSPIKSLSNQKLRDFRQKFEDVGLVTGDVSINETAECVIMTTEILRSMLYRGADLIRDVRFVIFDEVQFLNDEERGVVWEEAIIMLPPHIAIIMLSATVPNALEFSQWVGRTKDRQVFVFLTDKRPVPLKHAILFRPVGDADKLESSVLLDQNGTFMEENCRHALSAVRGQRKEEKNATNGAKASRRNRQFVSEYDDLSDEGAVEQKGSENSETGASLIPENTPFYPLHGITDESLATETNAVESNMDELVGNCSGSIEQENSQRQESHFRNCDEQNREKAMSGSRERKDSKQKKNKQFVKGKNRNKGVSTKSADVMNPTAQNAKQGHNRSSPWTPLVNYITDEKLEPTIVFCFSKKKCELAVESLEHFDLLPESGKKSQVHSFFEKAVSRLRVEDRNLPQVQRVVHNLKRGIAAHHAGLLPLVKEITEILFAKGFVKLLFATETFAMGVNMPARSVVFLSVRKHDGRRRRLLESGEYTQMSGRAGRRGIDNIGHVLMFFPPDEGLPDVLSLKRILTAKPFSLKSAFRLTYNMILNVLRVDELRVEEVMKRSFSEAVEGSKSERIGTLLLDVDNKLNDLNIAIDHRPERLSSEQIDDNLALEGVNVEEMKTSSQWNTFTDIYRKILDEGSRLSFREINPILRSFVRPGRAVVVQLEPGWLCLGTVFSIVRSKYAIREVAESTLSMNSTVWVATIVGVTSRFPSQHIQSVLLMPSNREHLHREYQLRNDYLTVVTRGGLLVSLRQIKAADIVYICEESENVSKFREDKQSRESFVWHTQKLHIGLQSLSVSGIYLEKVVLKWGDLKRRQVRFLSEVSDFKRPSSPNFAKAYVSRVAAVLDIVGNNKLPSALMKIGGAAAFEKAALFLLKERVETKVKTLQQVQATGQQPTLLPEYNNRVRVLQELGYVGTDGVSIHLKGRCACEVATVDCVVLTEIVMENVLNGLTIAEVASLLSSLVCRKKNEHGVHQDDSKKYSVAYCEAKDNMRKIVSQVGEVQERFNIELDFEIADGKKGYEDSMCRWDLAEAIYAWASGKPFCEVITLTEQQEGDIVVCVKRLCELIKDTQSVADGVGNVELVNVLDEVTKAIRRDVIFNGSLYYE